MNIIKKSDLMEFVSEKKQMLLGKKMESAAEPAVAPPKTKPTTKPGTKPTPSTPKHPKPAVSPKPKAVSDAKKPDWHKKKPWVNDPTKMKNPQMKIEDVPTKTKVKPWTEPTTKSVEPKMVMPEVKPKEKKAPWTEPVMTKKIKINKKYPKKFVKEHISSYFCIDIVNESINDDYSVELQLVGEKSELVKCLRNLKEGNVIN